jgi:RsiW-degrading membrane proteinase PrsW (M82 family)
VSWAWGLMAGFLHAAVSPAVVIPAAIALQEQSLGTKSGVPTRSCFTLLALLVHR